MREHEDFKDGNAIEHITGTKGSSSNYEIGLTGSSLDRGIPKALKGYKCLPYTLYRAGIRLSEPYQIWSLLACSAHFDRQTTTS